MELVAYSVTETIAGVVGSILRWNENTTFSPFLSNAIMLGMSPEEHAQSIGVKYKL